MLKQTITSVCLILAFICIASADEPREPEVELITTESHGKVITIPRFMPDVKLSEKRYAFDNQVMKSVAEEIRFLTNQILIRRSAGIIVTKNLMGLAGRLAVIFLKNRNLKRKDKESPVLESGLGVTNGEMLEDMLKLPKSRTLLTPEEAQERVVIITDAMVKVTELSNTGAVLEWPKMKLDGVPTETYIAPVIQMLDSIQVRKVLHGAANHLIATKDDR